MTSFPFFPVAATGETVFSTIGRCAQRTGIADRHLLFHLTGQYRKATIFSALPGYLRTLSQSIPDGHPWKDTQELIASHTSLPYFTYFDPAPYRTSFIRKLADSEIGQQVSAALGLTHYRSAPTSKHPRFCPHCVRDEENRLGFAFFHREHQLPGVAFCWKHGVSLAHGCTTCGPYPIVGKAFSLAGRCKCDRLSPLNAFQSLPPESEALLWIAQESAFMVASGGTSHVDATRWLRKSLLDIGLCRGTHVAYSEIASALDVRYSAATLEWLGYSAWKNGKPSPWIRRIFTHSDTYYKRRAAITQLLILGLAFDSVKDFEFTANAESGERNVQPSGAGSHRFLNAVDQTTRQINPDDWRNNLKEKLQAHNFRIPATAFDVGVSSYTIAAEARMQGIRIPLSAYAIKRLGNTKLETIHAALKAGVQKKRIRKKYSISEWTLLLIELDDLSLTSTHRETTYNATRERHRNTVRNLIEHMPLATRSLVMTKMPGTYDFLMRKDKEWFHDFIPATKRPCQGKRGLRVDWMEWDRALAASIQEYATRIRASAEKPRRITASSLLKAQRALARHQFAPHRMPATKSVLEEVVESKSAFLERKILWGIRKMTDGNRPVSINALRRVIGTPASKIREHKRFVLEAMERLDATVAPRSFFE